jgi:hypothetical protein
MSKKKGENERFVELIKLAVNKKGFHILPQQIELI